MKSVKNVGRGGARSGAGRKPVGKAPAGLVTLRMPPELRDELRRYLKERSITVREFIEEALKRLRQ